MHSAQVVIAKFGGQSALGRLLGKSQSTVQHWAEAGRIPAKWQSELLRLARERGIDLSPSDFVTGSSHAHVVQFYDDDSFLIDGVARFLGAGLEAGQAGIVIATPAHREMVLAALGRRGFDMAAAVGKGTFVAVDAAETLSKFMVNGRPDKTRCLAILKSVIDQANRASGLDHPRAAAFGEMVALLWKDGKREAAIEVEQIWNELEQHCDFSLLCGYPMDAFQRPQHGPAFLEVCSQHAEVIPAESYSNLSSGNERHRMVARLQQRAQALEAEVRLGEQRCSFFEDMTGAASWELDLVEDTLMLSARAQQLLGLASRERVPLAELYRAMYYSADQQAFATALKRARTGRKEFTVNFRVRQDGGKSTLLSAQGKTFFNSGQPLLVGILTDLTPSQRRARLSRAETSSGKARLNLSA